MKFVILDSSIEMFSNLTTLLLFAVIVLQGCNARPYQDKDSAVHALEERLELAHIIATEDKNINLFALKKLKVFFEEVLKDPEVLQIQSDLMKSNLEEIRNYIEDVKELEKKDEYNKKEASEILQKYHDIGYKYKMEVLTAPEDKIIKASLTKAGFENYIDLLAERFKVLNEKCISELDRYVDGLTPDQRKDEADLLKSIEELKADKDFSTRGEKIRDLIRDFELEKFLW